VDWNRDDPLFRNKGESRKANDALRAYYLMGSGRSLAKLHQKYTEGAPESAPTCHLRTLKGWSTRFDWQARVDRAKELDDEAQLKQWEQRRREWKQEEWDVAHKLLEKAEQMLQFPVGETVRERPDGSVVIVKPAKWRATDIARYAEVASKLVRLAAEMETERERQEGEITIRVTYEDESDSEAKDSP
jgi:hypothetical protein